MLARPWLHFQPNRRRSKASSVGTSKPCKVHPHALHSNAGLTFLLQLTFGNQDTNSDIIMCASFCFYSCYHSHLLRMLLCYCQFHHRGRFSFHPHDRRCHHRQVRAPSISSVPHFVFVLPCCLVTCCPQIAGPPFHHSHHGLRRHLLHHVELNHTVAAQAACCIQVAVVSFGLCACGCVLFFQLPYQVQFWFSIPPAAAALTLAIAIPKTHAAQLDAGW